MSTTLRLAGVVARIACFTCGVAACGQGDAPDGGAGAEPDLVMMLPGRTDGGDAGARDSGARVDLAGCGMPCAAPTPLCDLQRGRCVACLDDGDCLAGTLCHMGACAPGCNRQRGCGDGGACEVDAGVCLECLVDADCARLGDPARAVCEGPSGRCVPCRVQGDTCPAGQYCRDDGQGHLSCAPGCRADADCQAGDAGAHGACCGHVCVDTFSSTSHCGACGVDCQGRSCCAGACADLQGDARNCGACGKACAFNNAAATCRASVCTPGACNPGFSDCNANPMDGCEVSLSGDTGNCGACGKSCAVPNAVAACIGGACSLGACNPGFRNCDGDAANGCETNSDKDSANCGGCGSSCAQLPQAMAQCVAGACAIGACAQGYGNCDKIDGNGCEVDITTSLAHCGACGSACPVLANVVVTCVAGKCVIGGCAQGYTDCDMNMNNGCEVRLASDLKNCGACGNACAGNAPNAMAGCINGMCSFACNAGWGNCDNNLGNGCERDTSSDAANCGACGKACAGGEVCVLGMCVTCAAGRYEGPAAATVLGMPVNGTISLTLGAPANGVLNVNMGTITMTGANMAMAAATVTGTLDCGTKKFSGQLINGTGTILGIMLPPFTGTAAADYVLNPSSFANGTTTVMGNLIGPGTWSATWLGP